MGDNENSKNKDKDEYVILKELIIERRKHLCEQEKNKRNEKNEN